jgi:hypothetical protein
MLALWSVGDALASSKRSGKSTGLLLASYAAADALRHTRYADLPYPLAPPRKIGRNKSDEAVGQLWAVFLLSRLPATRLLFRYQAWG